MKTNIYIEDRVPMFRIKEGKKDLFKELFEKYFGEYFFLLTKEEIKERKIFGDVGWKENELFNDSLGDFIAINKNNNNKAFFDEDDYAGVFGVAMDALYVDKYTYCARVNGKWLPEVAGRSDYAGIMGRAITDIAIKGNVKYRVHVKSKNRWLPWVDGKDYNINDYENGYAGNGSVIDAIEIKKY